MTQNFNCFKYVLNTILLFGIILTTNAQLENANWYFGNQAAIDFNDGTLAPNPISNSAMNAVGTSASVSDLLGGLLFYTDGLTVWNKDHQVMTNGTGLYGSTTVSQSVLIVPNPDNSFEYYIFTNQGFETGTNGLSYSVVDMTLNSGKGDVKPAQKNIQVLSVTSEKVTAIFNPIDRTYWVVVLAPSIFTEPYHTDTFYAYKIDGSGVNLANQSTNIFQPEVDGFTAGQMKISPDGTTLAMIHNTYLEILTFQTIENVFSFDFDMATGGVTGRTSYALEDVLYCYGLEFSPDSDKFFVSSTHRASDGAAENFIHQIYYRNAPPLYIAEQIIAFSELAIYSLQVALDGNIYAANDNGELDLIGNPDGVSQEIDFEGDIIHLDGPATKGLPQLVPYDYLLGSKPNDTKKYSVMGNPFEGDLNIKFHAKEKYTTQLFDMYGRQVISEDYDITSAGETKNIETGNLSSGIYKLIIKDLFNKEYNATVLKK